MDLKVLGASFKQGGIIHLGADDRVRADIGAFAALNADLGIPDRDLQRDVAFFPYGGAGWISAVIGDLADRQVVAVFGDDGAQHLFDKGRGRSGYCRVGG